ncbi:MAG: PAS domain S-box protein, partial [Bacteroidales bacterium]
MNTSHELFLLMANLSQLHNKEKIIELFTEGMTELFKPSSFAYREHQKKRSKPDLEIKTKGSHFGYIETKQAKSLSEEDRMLVQNAVQMLAVILEHLDFELRLQDEKLSLEQIADKRFIDLQKSVEELKEARKNSLKLIDELNDEIKKRTKFEEELKESEERYRLILENSMDAMLLTLPDGPIISANRAACEMFGMSEEEICATGRFDIVDRSDENLPVLVEERNKKGKVKGELRFVRKDGSIFPAEVTSSVFTLGKDQKRTSIIIRDITDRVKSERELRRIEWMLTKNFEKTISNAKEEFIPYYGDLTYLNKSGLILDSVGH